NQQHRTTHQQDADRGYQRVFPCLSPFYSNYSDPKMLMIEWRCANLQGNHKPSFTIMTGQKQFCIVMHRPIRQPFGINPTISHFQSCPVHVAISDKLSTRKPNFSIADVCTDIVCSMIKMTGISTICRLNMYIHIFIDESV